MHHVNILLLSNKLIYLFIWCPSSYELIKNIFNFYPPAPLKLIKLTGGRNNYRGSTFFGSEKLESVNIGGIGRYYRYFGADESPDYYIDSSVL